MGTCVRCLEHINPGEGKSFNNPRVIYCTKCYEKVRKEMRTMRACSDKDQRKLVDSLVPYMNDYLWSLDRVSEAPPFGSD